MKISQFKHAFSFVTECILGRFNSVIVALTLSIIVRSVSAQAQSVETGFKINGVALKVPDSTLLYLQFGRENDKQKDSAYVLNERFHFNGHINSPVERALIRTGNYSDYKFFWLENAAISFDVAATKFRDARITGSKTQVEQLVLDDMLDGDSGPAKVDQYTSFIKTHPNSIISAYILSAYGSTWGKETTAPLYNSLSAEMKASSYGKETSSFLSLNVNVKVGEKYVDFSQPDTSNKLVHLSDYKGKVVLLEFWGSWCGPCRKSNPQLVKIYHEFKDKGFNVFGVSSETNRQAWLNAIEKDKLPWTNVTELKGDKNNAALIYGISYYPTNFLIDASGTIIARDVSGNELRRLLKKLL